MSISEKYRNQVSLLLEIMPYVAKESFFALKGGSAINMFYNNIPRLSVDLDLVYLPTEEHTEACKNINSALGRITDVLRGAGFQAFLQGYKDEKKIICSNENATVKIEPNYTIRGTLLPAVKRAVSEKVKNTFGYAEMNVLSFEELYAGKICAALDRQHPRDLFDIKILFEQSGGITKQMMNCFVVYLLGHNRPVHELLDCTIKDNQNMYEKEFIGMTDSSVPYSELISTLHVLKQELKKQLEPYKKLLLDFVSLNPDFSELPFDSVLKLPSIKWKIKNLTALKEKNEAKFSAQYTKLDEYFS